MSEHCLSPVAVAQDMKHDKHPLFSRSEALDGFDNRGVDARTLDQRDPIRQLVLADRESVVEPDFNVNAM